MIEYSSSTGQSPHTAKNREVGGVTGSQEHSSLAQHTAYTAAHNVYQHTTSVLSFIQTLQKILLWVKSRLLNIAEDITSRSL